jgi:hypothetical protein
MNETNYELTHQIPERRLVMCHQIIDDRSPESDARQVHAEEARIH